MNNNRRTLMPNLNMQQQMFDVSDAASKPCESCGANLFNQAVRLGMISGMNPKNRTGKDVLIKFEIYVCRTCGHEYGQPVKLDDEGGLSKSSQPEPN